MSPDFIFWLSLAVKLMAAAALVVSATLIAERAGAFMGSLIATLPISSGPAYVFLSAEHDAAFISSSALVSFATNPAVLLFSTVYVLAARRYGLATSMLLGVAAWATLAFPLQSLTWSVGSAVLVNAVAFSCAIWTVASFRNVAMPRVPRRWYDLFLRAGLVMGLTGTVLLLSGTLGPALTGTLAVFPVVFPSIILILHPRVGGPATAAVIANGMSGLIGFAGALLVLHLAVLPLGAPLALTLALLTGVAWNLLIFAVRRTRPLAARIK
jgi:hypothetical protein